MHISIVVAASENNVIGINNQLPWHLPDDLKFFKRITMDKPILMGKNTWMSIGKRLPGRLNIVLSASLKDVPEGVLLFSTLEEAIYYLEQKEIAEVCIIGGGQIYATALPFCHRVYLTRVHTQLEHGSAFFPILEPGVWQLVQQQEHPVDEKHLFAFTFQQWDRIR